MTEERKLELLKLVDHTELAPAAVWKDIERLCDEAVRFGTASVCIPPSYVKRAKEYTRGKITICTVIGFPNGYMTTAAKVFEAGNAVAEGADEIDMVINLGWIKDGLFDQAENEIRSVKEACGNKILKVIIETCLLCEEEKIKLCHIVSASGADFIKTSTGFSTAGAVPEDIRLFAEHVDPRVKIKAAGGISSFEDAEHMVSLGAHRLGTSRLVKLAREWGN